MTDYKLISMLVPVADAEPVEKAIPVGTLCTADVVDRETFRSVDNMKQLGLQQMTAFARALDLKDEKP